MDDKTYINILGVQPWAMEGVIVIPWGRLALGFHTGKARLESEHSLSAQGVPSSGFCMFSR